MWYDYHENTNQTLVREEVLSIYKSDFESLVTETHG